MKELIIHVGHSKCASSTVQKFLSRNPIIRQGDLSLSYYCITRQGNFISGDVVKSSAEKNPHGYAVSDIDFNNPVNFFHGLKKIQAQSHADEVIVISNEGLGNLWRYRDWPVCLDEMGVPVRVFMLTRPPIDWINASWWQWGCWETEEVEDWFNRIGRGINFKRRVDQWKAVKSLEQLFVADMCQGPLELFSKFSGIQGDHLLLSESSNVGSTADLLRFLLLNKEQLGRSTHDASIEFELNSRLKFRGRKAPFVLSESMIDEALSLSRADHTALLNDMYWFDEESKESLFQKYLVSDSYLSIAQNFEICNFLKEGFDPRFFDEIKEISLDRLSPSSGLINRIQKMTMAPMVVSNI